MPLKEHHPCPYEMIMRKTRHGKTEKLLIALLIAAMLMLAGCGSSDEETSDAGNDEPQTVEFFAMDTYMTLSAYGDNADEALAEGEDLVLSLDNKLSAENKDSQIAKLNRTGKANIDEDAAYLIERALELYKDTSGKFNIGIYPVMKAWGFTTKKYTVPSERKLRRLVRRMDLSALKLSSDGKTATIGQKGLQIDLGGIAKGYVSAKVLEMFKEKGIEHAMVNLGGNVQTLGTKPDGSPWRVAIKSPFEDDENFAGVIETSDEAVITSGGYERYFEKDGKKYHHIMDPDTGHPADRGLISVTVVSKDGTLADGLSTSLYIMGKDKALEYWKKHRDRFDAVIMDEEKELYVTGGLKDSFTSDAYHINIVE